MTTTSNDDHHAQIPAEHVTSRGISNQRSSKRFKFKSKSKTSKRHDQNDLGHSSEASSTHHHHHHHRHHHRHKRRRRSTSPQVNAPSPENVPASTLHPDIAFRESLFDAMGDDEGAAYWESVYGQPIHTYPAEKRNEETGELERMSDEEYIAFVRRGMWERSWEGVEAERKRRRKESLKEKRERKDVNRKKMDAGGSRGWDIGSNGFEWEIEESLRRGLERKQDKMWREKWEAYEKAWDDLYLLARSSDKTINDTEEKPVRLRDEIVWPVESGKREDVNTQEIERFMAKTVGPRTTTGDLTDEESALASTLKLERVRWHPDKVQQRLGSLNIDDETLRGVTEVFQVMDRLYNERK